MARYDPLAPIRLMNELRADFDVERYTKNRIQKYVEHSSGVMQILGNEIVIPTLAQHFPLTEAGFGAAKTHAQTAGLRTTTIINAETLESGNPFITEDLKTFYRQWAADKGPGAQIALNTFDRTEEGRNAAMDLFEQGALVTGRKHIKALQFQYQEGGKTLSASVQDIIDFEASKGINFGIDSEGIIGDFGKLSKRLDMMISPRQMMESSEGPGEAFKVGVFDPSLPFNGVPGMPPVAVEGSGKISKTAAERLVKVQRTKAEELIAAGKVEGYAKLKQVEDLEKGIKRGAFRMQNTVGGNEFINLNNISDEEMARIDKGMFKGMLVMDPSLDKVIDPLTGKPRYDFIIGLPNISTEVTMDGAIRRTITTNPLKSSVDVYADLQSITSNPGLFRNADDIIRYNDEEVQKMVAKLQNNEVDNRLTDPLIDEFDKLSVSEQAKMLRHNEYRLRIKGMLDAGIKPSESPQLMEMLLNESVAHLKTNKLLLPSALRAYLMSDVQHKQTFGGTKGFTNVPRGAIKYNSKTDSWVYNREDAEFIPRIMGDADNDDAVNGLLRYDTESKKLILPAYRNPNSMGEWFKFTVDPADESILEILRRKDETLSTEYRRSISAEERQKGVLRKQWRRREISKDQYDQYVAMTQKRRMDFVSEHVPHVEASKLGAHFDYEDGKIVFKDAKGLEFDAELARTGGSKVNLHLAGSVSDALYHGGSYGGYANAQMLRSSVIDQLTEDQIAFMKSHGFDARVLPSGPLIDVETVGGRAARVQLEEGTQEPFKFKEGDDLSPYTALDVERRGVKRESVTILPKVGDFRIHEYVDTAAQTEKEIEELFFGLGSLANANGNNALNPLSVVPSHVWAKRALKNPYITTPAEAGLKRARYNGLVGDFLTEDTVPDTLANGAQNIFNKYAGDLGSFQDVIDESRTNVPDYIKEFRSSSEYVNKGEELFNRWKQFAKVVGSPEMEDLPSSELWDFFDAKMAAEIKEFGGGNVERINRLMIAMLQQSNEREAYNAFFTNGAITDKLDRAYRYARAVAGVPDSNWLSNAYEASRLLPDEEYDLAREVAGKTAAREEAARAAEEIITPVTKGYQKLINKESLKELFENPLARGIGIGVAALAGLGLVRGHLHREPPAQHGDGQGPQMMPGGNPYDNMFPSTAYGGSAMGGSSQSGVRYTVNTRGNYDQAGLQSSLSGMDSSLQFRGGTTYYASRNKINSNRDINNMMSSY